MYICMLLGELNTLEESKMLRLGQDGKKWSWETGTGEGFQPVQAMERCLCFRQDLELSPQASWLLL